MAAPNLKSLTTVTGKTAAVTPANTSDNVLLSNASSSGKVLKVNQITVANTDASTAYSATIALCSAAAGSGTQYKILPAVSIDPGSPLEFGISLYLEEDKSLVCKSSTASKLDFIISYEDLS